MIRPAAPDDVPVILGLIRALAVYEKLEAEVVATEDDLREHLFGARPFAECLLAEEGGIVIGFALFFHNYSTFRGNAGIYLEDLFVRPEHRSCGHGRALFAELARIAVERGCARLEWAVLDWNAPSIAFYESLGAEPMDEWTTFRLTEGAIAVVAETGAGTFPPRASTNRNRLTRELSRESPCTADPARIPFGTSGGGAEGATGRGTG